jgi:hypothetical protein
MALAAWLLLYTELTKDHSLLSSIGLMSIPAVTSETALRRTWLADAEIYAPVDELLNSDDLEDSRRD